MGPHLLRRQPQFYDQRLAMNLTLLFGCYKLHSKCEGAVHCIALVRLLVMCALDVPPRQSTERLIWKNSVAALHRISLLTLLECSCSMNYYHPVASNHGSRRRSDPYGSSGIFISILLSLFRQSGNFTRVLPLLFSKIVWWNALRPRNLD